MRIKIVRIFICVLFVIVGLDLFYIQVLRGKYFFRLSTHNRIRVVPIEGQRGRIFDRNGVVLADNRISFNVMITPQEITNKDELFSMLTQVLGVERRVLLKRFHKRRYTPFAPVLVAEDINRKQAFVLEEKKFNFPSLLIQKSYRRRYPFSSVGAHAIGYVGKINRSKMKKLKDYGYSSQSIVGYSGVEEIYDSYLRGDQGGIQVEVNSRGQQVRLLGFKESVPGRDITLTIDSRIQTLLADALDKAAGTIIILDVDDAQVLGMVNAPSYDPNAFVDEKRYKDVRSFFNDESSPLLNRAIKGLYPPGSVFKVVIAYGALASGKLKKENEFECPGYFRMGRRRIRCVHKHGVQDLIQAIAHSCNVYFINTGLLMESEIIAKYARMFGFNQLTHIDLPSEETGRIPSKKRRKAESNLGWYKGDTANLAIGQGAILITPIQLVEMMATVARNGKKVQPHLILDEDIKKARMKKIKKVRFDKEHLEIVKEGLFKVVHDEAGTARLLNIENLDVSGKTGTAQSSPGKRDHAWFVGYAVSEKRKIAFCVFLEHGGSSYYATRIASSLLKKLLKEEII